MPGVEKLTSSAASLLVTLRDLLDPRVTANRKLARVADSLFPDEIVALIMGKLRPPEGHRTDLLISRVTKLIEDGNVERAHELLERILKAVESA